MVANNDKTKKVAIVAHGAGNGGAGRASSILANQLSRQGYQVMYIAFLYTQVDYDVDSRIQYVKLDKKHKKNSFVLLEKNVKICKSIMNFQPDVVISFMANMMLFTSICTNLPIIYSLRNDPNMTSNSFRGRTLRNFLYKRAKNIVFQTPGARDYFSDAIKRKGVVIGNPLTYGLPYWKDYVHEKVVVTACRLDKQKNIPMLLMGFSEFVAIHPEYRLKICGDGPLKESLIQKSKELKIDDKVDFLGFCDNVSGIMVASSIFALTSDFEGLSNSMLEALAIGIPTVCTDCTPGGAALYINNGENGILVPVGDSKSLCQAFCRLAENDRMCLQMSTEAVKIRELLSAEKITEEWKRLI